VLHVTWTLTVEVLWYCLAPLLLIWKRPLRWPTVVVTLLVSSVWTYAATKGVLNFIYPDLRGMSPGYAYLFVVNHFFAQVIFFVLGAWVYFQRRALAHINPVLTLCLALLIFLAMPYYLIFNPIFITGIGISLLLVTALNSEPIRSRLVFVVSETSYAIYLCHFPVLIWVHDRLGLDGLKGVLVSIATILVLAVLSYVLIEKPFVRIGRLLTRGRSATIATA
jgi:exopolysaccharide production protein ExoZ